MDSREWNFVAGARSYKVYTVWQACAVTYFTGSGAFNRKMRQHAVEAGFTLNEHALVRGCHASYWHFSNNAMLHILWYHDDRLCWLLAVPGGPANQSKGRAAADSRRKVRLSASDIGTRGERAKHLRCQCRSLFARLGLAWVAPADRELGK
jgi:hypothetical protein